VRIALVALLVVFSLAFPASASDDRAARIVARARTEVARGVRYDPSYERIAYPGGDVDASRGACTDLVVRAVRAGGLDLQRAVHEDALRAPDAYPGISGLDASIDHRRVPNVKAWLERHAQRLSTRVVDGSWRAGDIVVWRFGICPACRDRHVGVISDKKNEDGVPLVLHNIGPTAREEDVLGAWTIVGHYRLR
jgi:uncharacterized protein YijF (DUF1287 family)